MQGNFDLRDNDPTGQLEAAAHQTLLQKFDASIPKAQTVADILCGELDIRRKYSPCGVANQFNFFLIKFPGGRLEYDYRYAYYSVNGKRLSSSLFDKTVEEILAEIEGALG